MMRWSVEETEKIAQMRKVLERDLKSRRQLPDVVGDRRLLRFLRGHGHNVEKASKMFAKFLQWRDEFDVDSIRDHILFGGLTSPHQFPCGAKILKHIPQIMLSHEALDISRNPVSLEHFNFAPEVVLREITKKEYTTFMIYTLEYKILLLEQLADEREALILAKEPKSTVPYGIVLYARVIRDLNGFGLNHIGSDGKIVLKWILELAGDNYPDLMLKCHMVNAPLLFYSLWFFMKGSMDPNTVKKVIITGTDFFKELIKEIPIDSIPTVIGGKFKSSNELIQFNTRTDGPFHSLDIDEKIEFATAKEMNYSLSQIYKNDENDHNITENKINLENSDLTDEDSEENMTDQIDFDKDSSYLTCKTEIKTVPVIKSITNSNENKNSKMTKEEKEIEIMRGYNSDITKYNEIIVQRNVISSFNSPKKDSINFREKLLKNGLEFSHILKIKIGRTNENFLESRVRMMEEKKIKKCEEEERGKREAERERERVRDTENHNELADLETVKRTRKGNSRCSDVSVMSSERSCKVNCSVQ